jgi:hypothetical protein
MLLKRMCHITVVIDESVQSGAAGSKATGAQASKKAEK